MVLRIYQYGEPILRKKCKRVEQIDQELLQLIEGMKEAMVTNDGGGIAAPQVGRDMRLFITYPPIQQPDETWERDEMFVFINPEILAYSEETVTMQEGCLSVPGVFVDVTRPVAIKIAATDLEGNRYEKDLTAYEARVFLHEHDHINGILMQDRVVGKERQEIEPLLRKIKKQTRKAMKR